MVYRNEHWKKYVNCSGIDCKSLAAYVRYGSNWTKIGHYGSECKQFQPLDLAKEREEKEEREDKRLAKEIRARHNRMICQILQNSPEFTVTPQVESEPQLPPDTTKNLFDIDIPSFCQLDDDLSE